MPEVKAQFGVQGNDVKKIVDLIASGTLQAKGGLRHIRVEHDSWCQKLENEEALCNCDPNVLVADN